MKNIKIDQPHFLPNVQLTGEMNLPQTGVVLISGENGVGKSTLCSYLYNKELFGLEILWTESNQFRSIYPLKVHAILNTFKENAKNLNQERYQKIYSAFNIETWSSRSWGELSSGQGQMLKLLMGLSLEGNIYLLDEPVHFLDITKLGFVSEIISELQKTSLIILIDHRSDWFGSQFNKHYQLVRDAQVIRISEAQ